MPLLLGAAFMLPTLSAHAAPQILGTVRIAAATVSNGASLPSLTSTSSGSFCVALTPFSDSVLAQIATAKSAAEAGKAQLQSELNARISQKDAGISATRNAEASTTEEVFASLAASASTNAQNAAVKEFKKAVTDSIAVRQEAVDAATQNYRTGLKAILDSQNKKIDNAFTAFETTVNASLSNGKSICSGGDAARAQDNLKAGLKTAKQKLAADIVQAQGAQAAIDSLAKQQKLDILHADQDYRGALNAAKNALKKAFPSTQQSTDAESSATISGQ